MITNESVCLFDKYRAPQDKLMPRPGMVANCFGLYTEVEWFPNAEIHDNTVSIRSPNT